MTTTDGQSGPCQLGNDISLLQSLILFLLKMEFCRVLHEWQQQVFLWLPTDYLKMRKQKLIPSPDQSFLKGAAIHSAFINQ